MELTPSPMTGDNNTVVSTKRRSTWSLHTTSSATHSIQQLRYFAHTLFLFTCDQILDTVLPGTAFALCGALSGHVLDLPTQDVLTVLGRTPIVSTWLWLVILQFCLQNQRNADSVEEDALNKPWRPIPSKRITSTQAGQLLLVTSVLAGLASYKLHILPIYIVYICLITAYNDIGCGDKSGVLRNLFCGAGFTCYFSGAMNIALGLDVSMSFQAWKWTAVVAFGILATTIQTQEFRDEEGDRMRGRRTLVIELGRRYTLSSLLVIVPFWTLYISFIFFGVNWKAASLPMTLGSLLTTTLVQAMSNNAVGDRRKSLDRRMYKIWCLFMFGLCAVPLLHRS